MTSPAPFSADLTLPGGLRAEAEAAARRLTSEVVADLVPVSMGRNSLVARIQGASGRLYALKRHRRDAGDPRDRIGTEAAALAFLHNHAVGCVPTVVARDADWLLLDWIDGVAVDPIGSDDIDQVADFVSALQHAGRDPAAATLPAGSEACFAGEDVLTQIDARFARLSAVTGEPLLAQFLADFARARAIIVAEARMALPLALSIAPDQRVLSPSDFGFHNALRRPDGRLVFIDFEYFGWDDPVKLTADFLLHPAMSLAAPLKHRFAGAMTRIFEENGQKNGQFFTRFQYLLPLYGLRWCMILLNEFIPGKEAAWAGAAPSAHAQRKTEQLNKAWMMLSAAINDHEAFPYEP